MTKIFLNSNEELNKSYPNRIPYSHDKICTKADGRIYKKMGSDQIAHGCSWKFKHIVLSVAAAALSIFLIPLAFKKYTDLLSKLWERSTSGQEKVSLYVLQSNQTELQIKTQKLKDEIRAFDQDQNLMRAFQDLEQFLSAHERDASRDLSTLNLDQIEKLKHEIFQNLGILNEKSDAAFLLWPGIKEFSTRYPNIWANAASYDLSLNDRDLIENCKTRHKRYEALSTKSTQLLTAFNELYIKILERQLRLQRA